MNGLTIIYTGNGKGKTTAAYGAALRAVGHGFKVKIIQFIKNSSKTGENIALAKLGVEIESLGAGFVGILGDKKALGEHQHAAERALAKLISDISSKKYDFVIADEILGTIVGKLLPEAKIIEIIKSKPTNMTLILTGRGATKKIIDLADTVTEMKEIKHHFQKGIKAKKGVEF